MYFLAIPLSIAIEGGYLSAISKQNHQTKMKWTPIIAGNFISGLLLIAIVFA